MSRVKTLALAAVVLFALASCAPMFEFNLFGALDTPPTPAAADYEGSAGLDQLGDDLNSPAVVDVLAADPDLVDDILSQIATEFLGGDPPAIAGCPGSDPEAQQAAILYADLALKTSEGEALVNNIVGVLIAGIDIGQDLSTFFTSIMPPEALASPAAFAAMIQGFINANNAYLALGEGIDPDDDGVAEGTLPPGARPGDVAQKAIISYVVAQLVIAVDGATATDPSLALYTLLKNPGSAEPAVAGLTVGDGFTGLPTQIEALVSLAAEDFIP
jgi:hypothetical protein